MSDHTSNLDQTKTCTRCGKSKPATLEFFPKHGKALRAVCKPCHVERTKEYNQRNREAYLARGAEWRSSHKELMKRNSRRWYEANKKKMVANVSQWKKLNPAKVKANSRAYRLNNIEKRRVQCRNRRARVRAAEGTHTVGDIRRIYAAQNGKCWWCGEAVGSNYHVDHRVAIARGGSNAPNNLVISCPSCNTSKQDKMPHEWNGRLL